jgi:hypothetical protein
MIKQKTRRTKRAIDGKKPTLGEASQSMLENHKEKASQMMQESQSI